MKRTAAVSIVLIAGLALAGCSAAGSSSFDVPAEPQAPEGMISDNGGTGFDSTGSSADGSKDVDTRSLIVTGAMTLTAKVPVDAAADAIRIVETAGGRIDGRQESAPVNGDKGSATLTLRIPTDHLDTTIDKLKELGELEDLTTDAVDVTSQVKDIDARVKSLQISVDRLSAFLASAKDIDDLLALEQTLSSRQSDLESMLAQQRSIAEQVSMATITLYLISEADAPADPPPATFLTGLEAGWNSFVTFVSGVVILFGILLPWIVFFGIIAVVVVFFVRRSMRRAAKPAE
jgi:hypothetical protein